MGFEFNHRIELTDENLPGVFMVMADTDSPKTNLHWAKDNCTWGFELKPPHDYVILLMASPDYKYPLVGKDKSIVALSIYKHQILRVFTV